jgi:hypothetical protein
MAVLVNKQVGNVVEGGFKAAVDLKPGQFVVVDYSNKTVSPVADATAGDGSGIKLVLQQNNTIDEQAVADADVVYKAGEYVPLRSLQVGDVITTDQFTVADYSAVAVGSKFAVGANGKVEAIGARTPELSFVVKEKNTLFGNNALKLEVVTH